MDDDVSLFYYCSFWKKQKTKNKKQKKQTNGLTLRSIDLLPSPAAFWRRGLTTKNTGLSNSQSQEKKMQTYDPIRFLVENRNRKGFLHGCVCVFCMKSVNKRPKLNARSSLLCLAVDEILFANSSGDLHSRKKKRKKKVKDMRAMWWWSVWWSRPHWEKKIRDIERERRDATAVEDSFISLTNSDDG